MLIATNAKRPSDLYVQELRRSLSDLEFERMTSLDLEAIASRDLKFKQALEELRLMNHQGALQELLVMFDLQALYDHFLSFNTALQAPYHNHYHAGCMIINCYEGAYHEGLSEAETRQLLIAAMFHDFDHTAGRQSDAVNVKLAGMAVSMLPSMGLLSPEDSEVVRSIIEITRYPFDQEPKTPQERIIRDADLMQLYENDGERVRDQYLGLMREVSVRLEKQLTLREFIEGQGKFFKEQVVWYTEWSQRKARELDFEHRAAHLPVLLGAPSECVN